ncbi:MAG: hypothetical protein HY756_07290 [Nitrospirae bacterium]|nr:hypothetical protein [Nitrospirota bacterium]
MKTTESHTIGIITSLLLGLVIISFGACTNRNSEELQAIRAERATIEKNLTTFDTLDYVVFSNQEWTRLHESHAKDIKVFWLLRPTKTRPLLGV